VSNPLPKVHTHGAHISDCLKFRTRLWRIWSDLPRLLFIGLNPSTAAAVLNDNTVEWLMRWAFANGFGGLEIGNVYPFRTAYPEELKAAGYPPGRDNFATLRALAKIVQDEGGTVACGWGTKAQPSRAADLVADFECDGILLHRWGSNKDGSPKHPLYLPHAAQLEQWATYA
jgi:hypothetical protein